MSKFRIREVETPKCSNTHYVIERNKRFLFFDWWSTVYAESSGTSWPLYFDNLNDAKLELKRLRSLYQTLMLLK